MYYLEINNEIVAGPFETEEEAYMAINKIRVVISEEGVCLSCGYQDCQCEEQSIVFKSRS